MLRQSPILLFRMHRVAHLMAVRYVRIFVTAALLASLASAALPAQPVRAAMTINVTTVGDNTTNDGFCSLREALSYTNGAPANLNCGPDTGTPYTINLPAGTYNITGGELEVGAPGNRTVTINGAGAASTIINQALNTARVIDLDPVVNGNVDVTISNVTISGGYAQAFGGGAILGGGAGDSLILSNSIITNNHTSGANSAAGISWSPAGSVTITNTTFSNNVSGQAAGAILFTTNDGSTLSITNSIFTGNTAGAASASAGGAIVLGMPGAGTAPTFIITHNTFTGNQATNAAGAGGAIYIGAGNLTLQYNRIVGNTAGVAGSGGLAVYGGTATATENWWGCNTGPGGACNGALLSAGSLTTSPYLFLRNTASPTTINAGGASTLTASFLTDSASNPVALANLSRVIGLPVSWSATNGTLSGQQATIQSSATATATLTNSNVCANSTGSATVDSATATATLTVQCPDLTAVKTNNAGGTTALPTGWNWTVHVANGGAGYAAFANGSTLLTDTLPNTGLTYGAPAVSGVSGLTGTVNCTIDGNSDLSCTASGPVQLAAGGSFDVVFSVTPSAGGPFANPRTAGSCTVDPGSQMPETNEANNTCSNTVTVNAPPAITSADNTTFDIGIAGSFTVTTVPGYPTATTISIPPGVLPGGVTFVDNGNGTATLAGTPDPGTEGTWSFTITASNGVLPNAIQNFTLTVAGDPSTLSFTRQTPATSPTNVDTLVFRVTFSEAVTGVDTGDFTVDGTTTATVTNVNSVNTSVYDVTVSGGDLASFNGLVGLDLNATAPADFITDLTSHNLPKTEPLIDQTYTLDNTAPTITINNPDTAPATSKAITASASDGTLTMSNTSGVICDGTLTFVAYSSQTFTSEADNGTRVCYRALDALGNISYSLSDAIAGIDITRPQTTIDTYPANPSNSASASFTFSGTDNLTPPASLTFECDLDTGGSNFTPCTSPQSFPGLGEGSHTLQVRAVDQAGNSDPTPASYTWVVDTIPPNTTITSIPSNPTSSTTAIFAFTGNDGGGTGVTSYACNLDGGGFVPCSSSWTYNGLGDGSHTFRVQATDAANNTDATPASITWSVDTSSPSVVVSSAATSPTNDPTFSVTVTFSEAVTGFAPTVAGGDLDITNGTASTPAGSGTTYTFNLSPSGQGPVTVQVPAGSGHDAAGNGNIVSNLFSITYDSVAPTVTITPAAGQLDPTSGSPINFTATFSETVTGFGLDVTDVTVSGTAGATTAAVTGSGTTYNVAVSGMTGGGTVIVSIPAGSAQDAAGNGNSASGNATVTFTPLGITSPNNVTFVAGNLSSFTVTTVGAPPPTLTYTFRPPTVTLPSGIGFVDNGNGTATLSGTPALGSVGTYNLTFTASNGVGPNATQDFTLTIEGPPGVARINSSADTGDGQIDENEHTSVAITQLLVVFNKAMNADTPADLDDALNVENYSLVRDGSTTITIDSISYNPATFTATLNINAAFAPPLAGLQNGQYTLTVEWDIEDTLGVPIGADFVRHFVVDTGNPYIVVGGVAGRPGDMVITDSGAYSSHFTSFTVSFNEDVSNAGGGAGNDDVTYPANYLLLRAGPNTAYDTTDCLAFATNGNLPLGDDIRLPTGPVTYNNNGGAGPFVATVSINSGVPLAIGEYRLFICGTTSIVDLAGNPLNGGIDSVVMFSIFNPSESPSTGFAPGRITAIPTQPKEAAYADLGDLWIEIPLLKKRASITGVPLSDNTWNVTWLYNQVGWLEGTAYPTWEGNSVLTAHGYTADGLPGPFANLRNLAYDDSIVIHLGGMRYYYAVRSNLLAKPKDTTWITRHETLNWLTLITCQQYDEKSGQYLYRRIVRAVLIGVEADN